jgi:hypothetical protein
VLRQVGNYNCSTESRASSLACHSPTRFGVLRSIGHIGKWGFRETCDSSTSQKVADMTF